MILASRSSCPESGASSNDTRSAVLSAHVPFWGTGDLMSCMFACVQVMFGSGANEGSGLQGALPVSVFEALNRHFGVSFECFASPLNCYFKQFSSAFPDIDGYFGSRG